jgi:hypothetical protein
MGFSSYRSRYSQKTDGSRDGPTKPTGTTTNRGTAKANRSTTTTTKTTSPTTAAAKGSNQGKKDVPQELERLGGLKQQGLITEEEFQKLKADLLSKM